MSSMRIRLLVVTAASLCTLGATASVAGAKIVVGRSIAGVSLGQTRAQVRHVLGAPQSCTGGPCATAKSWSYKPTAPLYEVTFDSRGRVAFIGTWNGKQATSKGIHASMQHVKAGSTLAQIKAAYPGVKCTVEQGGSWFMCNLATKYHGRTRITFFWSSGSGHAVEIDIHYKGS